MLVSAVVGQKRAGDPDVWSDSPYPLPSQRNTSGGDFVLLKELHDTGVIKVTRYCESSTAILCNQRGICSP